MAKLRSYIGLFSFSVARRTFSVLYLIFLLASLGCFFFSSFLPKAYGAGSCAALFGGERAELYQKSLASKRGRSARATDQPQDGGVHVTVFDDALRGYRESAVEAGKSPHQGNPIHFREHKVALVVAALENFFGERIQLPENRPLFLESVVNMGRVGDGVFNAREMGRIFDLVYEYFPIATMESRHGVGHYYLLGLRPTHPPDPNDVGVRIPSSLWSPEFRTAVFSLLVNRVTARGYLERQTLPWFSVVGAVGGQSTRRSDMGEIVPDRFHRAREDARRRKKAEEAGAAPGEVRVYETPEGKIGVIAGAMEAIFGQPLSLPSDARLFLRETIVRARVEEGPMGPLEARRIIEATFPHVPEPRGNHAWEFLLRGLRPEVQEDLKLRFLTSKEFKGVLSELVELGMMRDPSLIEKLRLNTRYIRDKYRLYWLFPFARFALINGILLYLKIPMIYPPYIPLTELLPSRSTQRGWGRETVQQMLHVFQHRIWKVVGVFDVGFRTVRRAILLTLISLAASELHELPQKIKTALEGKQFAETQIKALFDEGARLQYEIEKTPMTYLRTPEALEVAFGLSKNQYDSWKRTQDAPSYIEKLNQALILFSQGVDGTLQSQQRRLLEELGIPIPDAEVRTQMAEEADAFQRQLFRHPDNLRSMGIRPDEIPGGALGAREAMEAMLTVEVIYSDYLLFVDPATWGTPSPDAWVTPH